MGPAALSQLKLNEPMPPWGPVCKPAPAVAAASSSPSCSKLNMEVKGAEIVEQDWVLLAKNFLQIAIYNISYMRGIFPEDYFTNVPELGVISKMLMPIDADSRRLTAWVKQGVYDALEKKYLETVLFCIHEKDEGPAIDEYAWNNEKTATFEFDKAESIQNLIRRLIRTCASFITNLDQMPKERTILMKIMYHDTVTPENYEPPFFECCTEDENVHDLSKRFGRLCVVSQRFPTMHLHSGADHHIFTDKAYMKDLRRIRKANRGKHDTENNDYRMKTMNWVLEEDVEVEVEDEDEDVEDDGEEWAVDLCCANHMVGDVAKLRKPKSWKKSFATRKGMITASQIGHVDGAVVLSNVAYSEGNKENLISVEILTDYRGCLVGIPASFRLPASKPEAAI